MVGDSGNSTQLVDVIDSLYFLETNHRWAEAMALAAKCPAQLPTDPVLCARMSRYLRLAGRKDAAEAFLDAAADHGSRERDLVDYHYRLGDVIPRFESLGSGCEFGLFQRECGYDSGALLRWAVMAPEALGKALLSNLEGTGDAPDDEIIDDGGQFWVMDRRYGVFYSTHRHGDQISKTELLDERRARNRALKPRLIAKLSQGGTIFVFRFIGDARGKILAPNELSTLHGSLCNIRQNRLLVVYDEEGKGGEFSPMGDHLAIAYTNFAITYDGRLGLDMASWADVCLKAAEYWAD